MTEALIFLATLIFIRNIWVYNRRRELNRFVDDVHLTTLYISYESMMVRFWVWDIEKLKKPVGEIK